MTPVLDPAGCRVGAFFAALGAGDLDQDFARLDADRMPVDVHGVDREERPLAPEIMTLAERLAAGRGAATAAFLQTAPFFAEKVRPQSGVRGLSPQGLDRRSGVAPRDATGRPPTARRARSSSSTSTARTRTSGSSPTKRPASRARRCAEGFGVEDYGCDGESCASRSARRSTTAPCRVSTRSRDHALALRPRRGDARPPARHVLRRAAPGAGLWDDTLIIVTGDHGEAFDEHGYFLHTTPHEETLRVPLLVKWPGARRRSGTHHGRDSRPRSTSRRRSSAISGCRRTICRGTISRRPGGWRTARLMISEGRRARRRPEARPGDPRVPARALRPGGRSGERTNLLPGREADAVRLEEVRRLAIAAAGRRAALASKGAQVQPFTAEEMERLRSLGYL